MEAAFGGKGKALVGGGSGGVARHFGEFSDLRSAVWRSNLFRIHGVGTVAGSYASGNDGKYFCGTDSNRICGSSYQLVFGSSVTTDIAI